MIRGVGVDIVEVTRIRDAMVHPRFVERILTPAERSRELTVDYVAGRWAVKEAVAKAVSITLRWHDLEVVNDPDGRPVVRFLASAPIGDVHVSISHEKGHAVGFAVWSVPVPALIST